jgi:hypothetical protein
MDNMNPTYVSARFRRNRLVLATMLILIALLASVLPTLADTPATSHTLQTATPIVDSEQTPLPASEPAIDAPSPTVQAQPSPSATPVAASQEPAVVVASPLLAAQLRHAGSSSGTVTPAASGAESNDAAPTATAADAALIERAAAHRVFLPIVIRPGQPSSKSPIELKYESLLRIGLNLGLPTTPETSTPDGKGRYRHYRGGVIYWSPETGAYEVHGSILEKWKQLGWERSALGYPTTDEAGTPDGKGRFNHFQHGGIYYTGETGAYEVRGEIYKKWKQLGWERSALGYPTTDEAGTPDGRGRFNHFQGGSIYYTGETGAHEIHGDIWKKWSEIGWEQSTLGYPVSDELTEGDSQVSYFQGGSIRWTFFDTPITYFQQNMALLPWPAPYKGTDRGGALRTLIENLRRMQPDVVGLSEMFVDGERAKVRQDLRDIYPYWVEGPDENDPESDGGLLLLSRHPIVEQHQTIYRKCGGDDCLANKGALHARIWMYNNLNKYDVFLTHTQNPNEGGMEADRGNVRAQLRHLASFIQAHWDRNNAMLLMGDTNTDAYDGGCSEPAIPGLYDDLKSRLSYAGDYGRATPTDLWKTDQFPCYGITSDNESTLSADKEPRAPGDELRRQHGTRIDHFWYFPARDEWASFDQPETIIWQSNPGRDMSDHYGLLVRQTHVRQLIVTVDPPISHVWIALTAFHCLETTSGPGSDEVYFRLGYETATGVKRYQRTAVVGGVDENEAYTFEGPISLAQADPGEWIDIKIAGWEEDDWPNGDDYLGEQRIRLSRHDLLLLRAQPAWMGRTTTRVLPRLAGDGGEYVVTLAVSIE